MLFVLLRPNFYTYEVWCVKIEENFRIEREKWGESEDLSYQECISLCTILNVYFF